MKTAQDLARLIDQEAATIKQLRAEYDRLSRSPEGRTEAGARKCKKIRSTIGRHNDEIAHLRRLARFVETASEEGVRMMLEQVRAKLARVEALAARFEVKPMRREYLRNSGAATLRAQVAELEFLTR